MITGPLHDVAIIGFGPVGATAANLLGHYGLGTVVIEREPDIYPKPRAVGMDHEVMRVFQSVGLADDILPLTGKYRPAKYFGANGDLIRHIIPAPPPFPYWWEPSNTFNQPKMETVLRNAAAARPSVDVRLRHELTAIEQLADRVRLSVIDLDGEREQTVECRYVLACDGAASPTRRMLDIGLEDLGFDEPWIVIDVLIKNPDKFPDTNIQYCEPERPMTYVVCPGNHRRWELMMLPGETTEDVSREERILEILSRWAEPAEFEIWRSAVYRFHALVAEDWRDRRVLVLGDAAHQTPPFMAQGMCQGIRDAANLAWKLDQVLNRGVNDTLLDTYQSERKPHVRTLTQLTKDLGEVICERDPDKAAARDARMVEEIKNAPGPTIRQNMIPPLTAGILDLEGEGNPVGTLFYQPKVRGADGRERSMEDAVANGFLLVVLDDGMIGGVDDDVKAFWHRLGGQYVVLGSVQRSADCLYLTDMDGTLPSFFAEHECQAIIVRPDRYIYSLASTADDLDRQLKSLAEWFGI